MDIELVFHSKDPRQVRARDFLREFVQKRGILARIVESDRPVESPTVIVDGQALKDLRRKPRGSNPSMYPGLDDIAQVIEKQAWCL